MKRTWIVIFFVVLIAAPFLSCFESRGASEEEVRSVSEKLERYNVGEAGRELKELLAKEPKDGRLLELGCLVAFHRGDYQEALGLIKLAIDAGGEDEKRKALALFLEQTIEVTKALTKHESPHFVILLDEKQDGFLAEPLLETLEATYRVMAEHYGFRPIEKVRVEMLPDSKAFYFVSTLSARDIEIGAVGLCKFNKLMFLSPAALVHGYRWLDAISHEYMHYLIVRMTEDRAPIWFHEGLAKHDEARWRGNLDYLSPSLETLLARALAEKRLIGFDQMEPSLVKLPGPDDVQLAYAEAASAIDFIVERVGHKGLMEVMTRMAAADVKGARDSIKNVLGISFDEFENQWKEFLTGKGFREKAKVTGHRYKIKEGKADEERMEMEEIKSLVARNRAHLGDLMRERGRMGAAVLEYRRALNDAPDSVPIMTRLSSALLGLDRDREVLDLLKKAKEISPDHPTTYTYLGKAYLKLKQFKEAREALETSIQINPFDPEVHRGLADVYEALGEKGRADKERGIAKTLTQR
jgi:tetratricopeptide (TPR) repeat protein